MFRSACGTSRPASAPTCRTCATAGRNSIVCGAREPEPRPGCRPAGRFPTIRRTNSISRRTEMEQDAKKTVLRMIPYGIYVLTADDGKGNVAAATVNWVTQTAFAPPLVVVGVKTDSGAYQIIKDKKTFALNMLGKDQKGAAFTFFKPTKLEDGKLSGQAVHKGTTGVPILDAAPAAVECRVTGIVEQGDHHIVVGEVVEAHLPKPISGRPDAAILEMKDLGDNVFYGG